jgi:SepF-like predicted cell division protein (DUF552 family)
LINEGDYNKAEMLINAEKAMQSEALSYEQENLYKELKNAITLGQIDSFGAQDLQKEINAGNLAVVKEELEAAKSMQTERVQSEEAMQTERIESEEGMFNSELELREAIATGKIDGMPTLDAMVTTANIQGQISAQKAEGLSQLLALVNAIEDEGSRKAMMDRIIHPMNSYLKTGTDGWHDLRAVFEGMLNVNMGDYLPREEG